MPDANGRVTLIHASPASVAGNSLSTRSGNNASAGSVIHVSGGMGSFNDHAPRQNGRAAPGMGALTDASGNVYRAVEA